MKIFSYVFFLLFLLCSSFSEKELGNFKVLNDQKLLINSTFEAECSLDKKKAKKFGLDWRNISFIITKTHRRHLSSQGQLKNPNENITLINIPISMSNIFHLGKLKVKLTYKIKNNNLNFDQISCLVGNQTVGSSIINIYEPPSKMANLMCVSPTGRNLKCNFHSELTSESLKINYTLFIYYNHKNEIEFIKNIKLTKNNSKSFNFSIEKNYNKNNQISIKIKARNIVGSSESNFFNFTLSSIRVSKAVSDLTIKTENDKFVFNFSLENKKKLKQEEKIKNTSIIYKTNNNFSIDNIKYNNNNNNNNDNNNNTNKNKNKYEIFNFNLYIECHSHHVPYLLLFGIQSNNFNATITTTNNNDNNKLFYYYDDNIEADKNEYKFNFNKTKYNLKNIFVNKTIRSINFSLELSPSIFHKDLRGDCIGKLRYKKENQQVFSKWSNQIFFNINFDNEKTEESLNEKQKQKKFIFNNDVKLKNNKNFVYDGKNFKIFIMITIITIIIIIIIVIIISKKKLLYKEKMSITLPKRQDSYTDLSKEDENNNYKKNIINNHNFQNLKTKNVPQKNNLENERESDNYKIIEKKKLDKKKTEENEEEEEDDYLKTEKIKISNNLVPIDRNLIKITAAKITNSDEEDGHEKQKTEKETEIEMLIGNKEKNNSYFKTTSNLPYKFIFNKNHEHKSDDKNFINICLKNKNQNENINQINYYLNNKKYNKIQNKNISIKINNNNVINKNINGYDNDNILDNEVYFKTTLNKIASPIISPISCNSSFFNTSNNKKNPVIIFNCENIDDKNYNININDNDININNRNNNNNNDKNNKCNNNNIITTITNYNDNEKYEDNNIKKNNNCIINNEETEEFNDEGGYVVVQKNCNDINFMEKTGKKKNDDAEKDEDEEEEIN